jgi:hypothetical protein
MARTTSTSFSINDAGTFFANKSLLLDLQKFQQEVEEDPNKYNRGVLLGFQTQFDIYGTGEFDRMYAAMVQRDFGDTLDGRQERMLAAMLDRHKGLWTQAITKAFSVAANSVEGRTQFGQPTILQRIVNFFTQEDRQQSSLGFFVDEHDRVFSTRKLATAAAEETTITVKMSALDWVLDAKVMIIEVPGEPDKYVTPRQLIRLVDTGQYPENDVQNHVNRTARANLNFPIIISKWGTVDATVVDGIHRILKAHLLGRRTIKAQVLRGGVPESATAVRFKIPTEAQMKPQLLGVARAATQGSSKRIFKQRLAPFVQMLYKTMGMNFRRDFEIMVARFAVSQKGGEQLFLINSHVSQVSSKTCRLCAGRVFTRESLRYAAQELSPNLFHPNCVHYVVRSFQETTETYDGKQGAVVTMQEIGRWISSGRTKKAKRQAPVSINV